MKASIIIPFYKDLPALELILVALNEQSARGRFEVVIAEDDDAPQTIHFLSAITPQLHYPVKHVQQPDEGYQRSKALNNGIREASNAFIIFIDGDCIPHRHFVKNYLRNAAPNVLLYGRRVNLGKQLSASLRASKNLGLLTFLTLLRSDSSRVAEALYLPFYPAAFKSLRQPWGCNMGTLKAHLISINGFDEDYKEWGPEDLDLCWRLGELGCRMQSVKYASILYHLFHVSKGVAEVAARGKQLYEEKKKMGLVFCKNGLTKSTESSL